MKQKQPKVIMDFTRAVMEGTVDISGETFNIPDDDENNFDDDSLDAWFDALVKEKGVTHIEDPEVTGEKVVPVATYRSLLRNGEHLL